MEQPSQLHVLFNYLYDEIQRHADHEVRVLRGEETVYTGPMKHRAVLQRYLTSDEAVAAFRQVLEMFGHSVIYDLMGVLQGEGPEGFGYRLSNRASCEDLSPDLEYRDEWNDFLYVKTES